VARRVADRSIARGLVHRLARSLALLAPLAFLGPWLVLAALPGCWPEPLAPSPGLPQYREIGAVPVPGGGRVDVAGGNLLLERVDLVIDTQLGPVSFGAVWNSADRRWRWSFGDLSVAGNVFTDARGASFDLTAVPDGHAVPGTPWVDLGRDAGSGLAALKTKGGLEWEFDAVGQPARVHWTSSADPHLGFESAVQGDGRPHLTHLRQCLAAGGGCRPVYDLTWDAAGHLLWVEDRAGRRAEFAWDAAGRLVSARDPLDVARGRPGVRYGYDDAGNLVSATSSEGERVAYGYDGRRRVVSVRQVGDATTGSPEQRFVYEPPTAGFYETQWSDALGHETRFRYDAEGRLHERESIDGGERTLLAWDGLRPTQRTAPDGSVTTWTWVDDDVVTRTDPSGDVTTFRYAADGVDRAAPGARPVLEVRDRLGLVVGRSYDAAGRLVAVENGAGEGVTIAYGADELVELVTPPAGAATRLSGYGEHGHPTSIAWGDLTRTLSYDAVGNLVSGPDFSDGSGPGLGGVVSRSFDEDRNVRSVTLSALALGVPATGTLTVDARSDGRPWRIARPGGGDSEFVYDALGRLVERRDRADGAWHAMRLAYDEAGRVVDRELPNGMETRWSYDALGRVAGRRILRAGVLEAEAAYVFSDGLLRWVLDSVSGSRSLAYDAAGRPVEVAYSGGDRTELDWDLRDRMVAARLRGGDGTLLRSLGFGYDAAGREASLSDGGRVLVARTFRDGRLSEIRYGNGLRLDVAYDADLGTPIGTTLVDAGGTTLAHSGVEWLDPDCSFGQQCIRAETDTWGPLASHSSEKYWLMPLEVGDDPAVRAGKRVGAEQIGSRLDFTFQYDVLGNLTYVLLGIPVYNAEGNRLLRVASPTTGAPLLGYAYDDAGYTIRRGSVPIAWDGAGRIAALGDDRFAWDADGRPVAWRVGGVETRFRFGGLVETDASGTPRAIDFPEVRIDLAGGDARYRHLDFRGNVELVSDAAGRLLAHYEYDAYGSPTVFGADGDRRRRFALGQQVGALVRLGHRVLDPATGRFLAPDPVFQLWNQYAYAAGNPVQLWDPGGQHPVLAAAATAVGGAGTAALAASYAVGAAGVAEPPLEVVAVALRVTGWGFQAVGVALALLNAKVDALQHPGGDKRGQRSDPHPGGSGAPAGTGGPVGSLGSFGGTSGAPGITAAPIDGGAEPVTTQKGLELHVEGLAPSGSVGCAPAALPAHPRAGRVLAVLVPVEVLLGALMLRRRARGKAAA
jgi:RHS repeat-associated protein